MADDLSTITRRWGTLLRDSASLNDWCRDNFEKLPGIFLYPDLMTPPGSADCPVIAISPDSAYLEPGAGVQDATIWVGWAVASEGKSTSGTVIENCGGALADEFGRRVLEAVAADQATHLQGVEFSPEKVHSYPIFSGEMLVSIKFKG